MYNIFRILKVDFAVFNPIADEMVGVTGIAQNMSYFISEYKNRATMPYFCRW